VSTLSDDHSDLIIEVRVLIAKLEERIIYLKQSNSDVEEAIEKLRKEQETRFRWTIYLFLTLLVIFMGVSQFMCNRGIGIGIE
jgi:hypothetical protein